MPRPPRAFYPGCYVHTTARGNNRCALFLEPAERMRFLDLMRAAARRHGVVIVTYCLMDNHVHILARYARGNVDAFMCAVLRPYAVWFNKRHGRTGHLFEDRYYSRIITDTDYLHEAGRYIHMNPVEAGVVASPEDFPWSGFRQHLAGVSDDLVDVEALTAPFRAAGAFDAAAFKRFTMERRAGPDDAAAPVARAPRSGPPAAEPPPPLPAGWLDAVCAFFGTDSAELDRGGRTREAAAARGVAMLLVFEELCYDQARIAVLFRVAGRESVSRCIRQAISAREADPRLAASCSIWAGALSQHC